MKAFRVYQDGSSFSPRLEDVPKQDIGPGELLIHVRASSVQPADIMNAKGGFPMTTFPRTFGKDFSGTVIDGPDQWIGKDVYGTSGSTFSFTEDGGQAEYAVLRENAVAIKPRNLSFAQAASVGTPFSTAQSVLSRAMAESGEVVMVLGASGSVGSAVMQIAKGMGCRTISVGRHGTDVNSVADPELNAARELTRGKGPDVVVDTVGDFALTKAAFNVLATSGRLSIITAPKQGSTEMPIDIKALYRRQVSLVGCNTAAQSQAAMAEMLSGMTSQFETGKLNGPDEKGLQTIPIEKAIDAYEGRIKKAVIVFDK